MTTEIVSETNGRVQVGCIYLWSKKPFRNCSHWDFYKNFIIFYFVNIRGIFWE